MLLIFLSIQQLYISTPGAGGKLLQVNGTGMQFLFTLLLELKFSILLQALTVPPADGALVSVLVDQVKIIDC
jgi:hypothetical protein